MAKKGFGQSKPPTREAKKFMRAFMGRVIEAKGNETKILQFLKSNRAKLNEFLLDALPLIFTALAADPLLNERENIAPFLVIFGNLIKQFRLGDPVLKVELSIAAYHLALSIYS
jgi:hypothetical protein